ncbi:MAG TPA: DUF2332 domain-containing protein [Gaiella sp.]|jgi:hypothetical protein|nr:DUF2332 domain-containing protein [Gaiella sp.]
MADALARQLRWQAEACALLGSPFYAALLERLAVDAESGGVTARVLAGHEDDPFDSILTLRLLGGVHRRVLSGLEPELAAHYPSTGGDGDADGAVAPLLAVLDAHTEELRAGLAHPPQTNEVGRAAPLVGALWHLQSIRELPVRLHELGASAGLNLLADRFRFEADAHATGPAGSPVVFRDAWRGEIPTAGPQLEIVERLGCDRSPVNPASDDGALTLMSYVWPDQTERVARLRGALAIAREVPVHVAEESAGQFLETLAPVDGSWTVVWHSVMWMYLDGAERRAVHAHLERAGAEAGERAPLAHVAFEAPGLSAKSGTAFEVSVRTWPGGDAKVLGHAPAHGLPVDWG